MQNVPKDWVCTYNDDTPCDCQKCGTEIVKGAYCCTTEIDGEFICFKCMMGRMKVMKSNIDSMFT